MEQVHIFLLLCLIVPLYLIICSFIFSYQADKILKKFCGDKNINH